MKKINSLRELCQQLISYADNQDEQSCDLLYGELNAKLDELLNEDFFGTEGQADPRENNRDN